MTCFPPLDLLGLNLLAAVGFMGFVWVLSLPSRNASRHLLGSGVLVACWLGSAQTAGYPGRKLLSALLTTIWGVRLALHIAWRNRGQGEDRRYQGWRAKRGESFW